MYKDESSFIYAFVISSFLCLVFGFIGGVIIGETEGERRAVDDLQRSAAIEGRAEYVADKDGNPVWKWKQ